LPEVAAPALELPQPTHSQAPEPAPQQEESTQADNQPTLIQARILTVDEAIRYMNIKPSFRRFFQDKMGRYNARLIEKYDWVWNGSRVVLIPKWFGDDTCPQPFDATASCGA
jgi:hypothetical protein